MAASETTGDIRDKAESAEPSLQAVLLRLIREAEDKIAEYQIRAGALKEALRAVESLR